MKVLFSDNLVTDFFSTNHKDIGIRYLLPIYAIISEFIQSYHFYLDEKLEKTDENTKILVGNFTDNFTSLTSDKVIGTSKKSLEIVADILNITIDDKSSLEEGKDFFTLENPINSFTLSLNELKKQIDIK